MIAAFAYSFITGIVSTLFPVYATSLNFTAFQIGLLFFLSNLVQTLAFVFSEKLIQGLRKTSFLIGTGAFTISLALMVFGKDAVAFTPSFAILGLGQGILYSSSLYYLLMEGDKKRGHATASFESTLGLASCLGPLVGGAIAQYGPAYPYVAGAVATLIILLVQLLTRK